MFNKVYLEPPEHLTFPIPDQHTFTEEERAELYEHYSSLTQSEWGCPAELFQELWPLSSVGTIPSVARFPSVIMDPSLRFSTTEPEPNTKAYDELVQLTYTRLRDQYKRIPEMSCAVCFLAPGAEWWPFHTAPDPAPVVIRANTPATLLQAVYLSIGMINPAVRTAYPKLGAPKRARAVGDGGRAARYQAWLAACAEYREQLEEFKAEYDAAFEAAEVARKRWRDFKAQGAPRWES